MAKHDLSTMTIPALLKLAQSDPSTMVDVIAEIERRNNAPRNAEIEVDWNSAGQVFIREGIATTLSSKGTTYRGSANIVASVMGLIVADSPAGDTLRKRIRDLLSQPKDVIQKRVQEKQLKKLARVAQAPAETPSAS